MTSLDDQPPDPSGLPPYASWEPPPPSTESRPTAAERIVALLEVVTCSDYPTQLALAATFHSAGFEPFTKEGQLSVGYVVGLSLCDTVFLIGLVLLFLHAHHERPRDVLFGNRPLLREARLGIPLTLVALFIGTGVLVAIQFLAPTLHNVAENPLEALIQRPRDMWLFALVVIVAGGIREEIQRAFILHRFEGWLGGATVGLVLSSIAFGAGHLLQGLDAAIATGLLGVFWGIVYIRRRSAIAPMVSHSGFNLLEIAHYVLGGR